MVEVRSAWSVQLGRFTNLLPSELGFSRNKFWSLKVFLKYLKWKGVHCIYLQIYFSFLLVIDDPRTPKSIEQLQVLHPPKKYGLLTPKHEGYIWVPMGVCTDKIPLSQTHVWYSISCQWFADLFFLRKKSRPLKFRGFFVFFLMRSLSIYLKLPSTRNTLPYFFPKTNIAPENWWLEDYFPFGMAYFHGAMFVSARAIV